MVNDCGTLPDGSSRALTVTEEIRQQGGKALANCDSVADRDTAEKIVTAAINHFGRLDIIINNAGIIRDKSFVKMSLDDFEEVLRVHLLGAVYITKAAFPFMQNANYGRILLTTSAAGLYGNFGQTNYAAAKLGLVGFMNALKIEGAKHNIAVNTIAPLAATDMAGGTFPKEISDKIKPEFVVPMALYLVSNSCRVTGKILSAGGGYYSSAQIIEGIGLRLTGSESITVEQISEHFSEIISIKDSRCYENASENVLHILSPLVKS